jgi:AsmA protein
MMNKAIKWGLIVCAGLVVLVIAVLLIAPAFIDIRDYKPELEKKVADATGRPFSVGDDLSHFRKKSSSRSNHLKSE